MSGVVVRDHVADVQHVRARVRIPSTLHRRSCSIYVFITSDFFVVVKVHYFAIRLAQGQEDIKMLGEFIHVFVPFDNSFFFSFSNVSLNSHVHMLRALQL